MQLTGFYSAIYSVFGVPAQLTAGSGPAATVTVNDLTKGVDIPDPANPGVKTIRPVARVRRSDLDAADVDTGDLDGATLVLNGITWTVSAWGPRPSPNGENDGEIEMILTESEGTA
jgi:hypothetical protein